jgi:hypothetical protein
LISCSVASGLKLLPSLPLLPAAAGLLLLSCHQLTAKAAVRMAIAAGAHADVSAYEIYQEATMTVGNSSTDSTLLQGMATQAAAEQADSKTSN